jgi:hypothetical protein
VTERRYNEKEVAAIFERATEVQQTARRQLAPGEGMTLEELQEIGREVGIPPALVAQAAGSIDQARRPASRTYLGLPIAVGRTVELGRRLSDEEWERMVVDLRETFDARGSVRYDGPFRQWTNGNLQVLVEPSDTGHRIRFQTLKGDARALMTGGLGMLGAAAVTLLGLLIGGGLGDPGSLTGLSILSLVGLGMFGAGALPLPRWARLRQLQMDGLATRIAPADGSRSLKDPTDQKS